MKKILLLFVAAVSIASCSADEDSETTSAASPEQGTPENDQAASTPYNYNADELQMLRLINDYRREAGLESLEMQDYMSLISEEHNTYMIENEVVNHDYFNDRVLELRQALNADHVGENVAYNYQSAQGAFDAWILSDAHRAAIEGTFTHIGISVSGDVRGHKYYTALFARLPEQ